MGPSKPHGTSKWMSAPWQVLQSSEHPLWTCHVETERTSGGHIIRARTSCLCPDLRPPDVPIPRRSPRRASHTKERGSQAVRILRVPEVMTWACRASPDDGVPPISSLSQAQQLSSENPEDFPVRNRGGHCRGTCAPMWLPRCMSELPLALHTLRLCSLDAKEE